MEIPDIRDRVVQAAAKLVLEPTATENIHAGFLPTGFAHGVPRTRRAFRNTGGVAAAARI